MSTGFQDNSEIDLLDNRWRTMRPRRRRSLPSEAGLRTLVIEAETVVSTIAHYPIYVRFFSTAEKLSLGDIPFVVATEKPSRRDALAYYRAVVRHFNVPLRQYERVRQSNVMAGSFVVHSVLRDGSERDTRAKAVVVATGYFGSPNYLGVPGEDLPHVSHVYREGHEAFDQDVVVVGGG
jgi:thioredoxin reductase (NADPH)